MDLADKIILCLVIFVIIVFLFIAALLIIGGCELWEWEKRRLLRKRYRSKRWSEHHNDRFWIEPFKGEYAQMYWDLMEFTQMPQEQ